MQVSQYQIILQYFWIQIWCDKRVITLIEFCPDIPGDGHDDVVFPHQFYGEEVGAAPRQRSHTWQVG